MMKNLLKKGAAAFAVLAVVGGTVIAADLVNLPKAAAAETKVENQDNGWNCGGNGHGHGRRNGGVCRRDGSGGNPNCPYVNSDNKTNK